MNTNTSSASGNNYSQTNVVSIVEQSLREVVYGLLKSREYKVYISDDNEPKKELPYLEIHGDEAQDMIPGEQGQGTGVFKIPNLSIVYKGHAKATDAPERQAVVDAINYFTYNNPVAILNGQTKNFFCWAFMPKGTGHMEVDRDLKAFVYTTNWEVVCMPSLPSQITLDA